MNEPAITLASVSSSSSLELLDYPSSDASSFDSIDPPSSSSSGHSRSTNEKLEEDVDAFPIAAGPPKHGFDLEHFFSSPPPQGNTQMYSPARPTILPLDHHLKVSMMKNQVQQVQHELSLKTKELGLARLEIKRGHQALVLAKTLGMQPRRSYPHYDVETGAALKQSWTSLDDVHHHWTLDIQTMLMPFSTKKLPKVCLVNPIRVGLVYLLLLHLWMFFLMTRFVF